tara:strand:+ start:10816 stop:11208 length:393 start_codon:yes stop_codon:yes gene_type:complete
MDKAVSFFKFVFHTSVLFLIIISLFPGSLIGFFLYGDLGKQPDLIQNPFGTALNHFIYYFYISILGLFIYLKNHNFKKLVYSLFFLSIVLELLQFIIPNRSFEFYDILANFIGVLFAYLLVVIYKFWRKL